jgi:hypothetical protein
MVIAEADEIDKIVADEIDKISADRTTPQKLQTSLELGEFSRSASSPWWHGSA